MATGSIKYEDYSLRVRSGDLVLRNVRLDGWQETPTTAREFTNENRLWGKITTGNVLSLYADAALTVRVAVSVTISAAGDVAVAEDNASGISGTLNVDYTLGEEQLFDIVLTYADELDLKQLYAGVAGELDASDQYEAQDMRFEALLKSVKRDILDPMIWERYGPRGSAELEADDLGRPLFANLGSPRQLARVHALLCVAEIYDRRASQDPAWMEVADRFRAKGKTLFDVTALMFDADADAAADADPRIPEYDLDRG